jgi:hypothetical protein
VRGGRREEGGGRREEGGGNEGGGRKAGAREKEEREGEEREVEGRCTASDFFSAVSFFLVDKKNGKRDGH